MSAAEWSVGAAGPVLRLLAGPPDADTRWQDFALCAELDGDLWFPERDDSTRALHQAKKVCTSCVVRPQCLEYALATETGTTRHGVWGGLSPGERTRLTRQRRKAAA